MCMHLWNERKGVIRNENEWPGETLRKKNRSMWNKSFKMKETKWINPNKIKCPVARKINVFISVSVWPLLKTFSSHTANHSKLSSQSSFPSVLFSSNSSLILNQLTCCRQSLSIKVKFIQTELHSSLKVNQTSAFNNRERTQRKFVWRYMEINLYRF